MGDRSIEKLRAECSNLLGKQIEALEPETHVGLTDAELHEYDQRQERIRDLDAKISKLSDPPPLGAPAAVNEHHSVNRNRSPLTREN